MARFLIAIGIISLITLNASANQGSPDSFGYVWTDSNAPTPSISYSWDEISSTGTSAIGVGSISYPVGCDNCGEIIPIGFSFNYYGANYTDIRVDSNGYMEFDLAGLSQPWNDPLPSFMPTGKVAPFWSDLNVPPSGAVYYETLGSAPNRYLVVQWNVEHLWDPGFPLLFQAVLRESGEIEFRYNTMTGFLADGWFSTLGIESYDGSVANEYSFFMATVTDNMAIEFAISGGGGGGGSVYSSADTPMAIPDFDSIFFIPGEAWSIINVPDSGTVEDITVTVDITHPAVHELDLFLISPAGTWVQLMPSWWVGGANYTGTTFDDAGGDIAFDGPPYSGTYFPPWDSLSNVDGENMIGNWTLYVADWDDWDPANVGTINSWSLDITTGGGGGGGGGGQSCSSVAGNPFVNCGFESGNFSGWVTQDLTSPFYALDVDGAGIDPWAGFFISNPTEGSWAALHGFDGDGPGTISIAQDVLLPSGGPLTLYFDHREAWLFFGGSLDRTFTVNVEPSGGGTPMQSTLILTAVSGISNSDTGPLTGEVDLTPFAGQDVRISFDWMIPENFTGPGFAQLDNVYVDTVGGYVAPVASDGNLIVDEDVGGGGTLVSSGGEGPPVYEVVDAPLNGVALITSSLLGTYTYVPDPDFEGSDYFTFNVLDGTNYSNIATVSITVVGTPDQPQLSSGPIDTFINIAKSVQVYHNDPDIGDVHTYVISSLASDGSASIDVNGVATYTPNLDFTGLDSFEVLVTDIDSLQDYLTIAVMVTAIDTNPPVDGSLSVSSSNSFAVLSWSGFTDDLGQITYTLVYDTVSTPTDCSSGMVLYSGMDTSFDHTNILNGTTYSYRLCATDTAGNVSAGVTGSALPYVASNGISLTSDDIDFDGIERLDGGDDDNNLDETTGNPITSPGFNFKIVAKDPGGGVAPIAKLYVTDRTSATSYATYDMLCTGDYTEGQLCSYTTILGPTSVMSYYFEVVLEGGAGSTLRYPASGNIAGPVVDLLNSYAVVGVARDIDSSNHDSTRAFGCMIAYRWVSEGLSTQGGGNKGYFELVNGLKPIKAGEALFVQKASCDGNTSLLELDGEGDIVSGVYEVSLQAGWNLVSNPYNTDVLLSNIEITKDGETGLTWADAATDGWVNNSIYYYDGLDWGGTYSFESAGGLSEAKLSPWTGYWLYLHKTDGDYKLIITKP